MTNFVFVDIETTRKVNGLAGIAVDDKQRHSAVYDADLARRVFEYLTREDTGADPH